jgi:molybdopterin-guanine dinucleotide biosynthesis protein A
MNPDITGLVLAGGRGLRMGGVDKGLVDWHGTPLALHALRRLQPQVARCCISANRHAGDYAQFGVPVLADTVPGFAGPLAGLLAALRHAGSHGTGAVGADADADAGAGPGARYVASVPCDVPHFPEDLVAALAKGLMGTGALAAVAATAEPQSDGTVAWHRQPTFCLVHCSLAASLEDFLHGGGRKAGQWLQAQGAVAVRIATAPSAFANANTLAELQAIAQQA